MKFFLDTADLDEIKEAASWGALAGAFLGPFLWGLYSKRISKAAVWTSFIVGVGLTSGNMIAGFFGHALIASPINCGALAMLLSLAIVPLVSLVTKPVDFDMDIALPSRKSATDREIEAEAKAEGLEEMDPVAKKNAAEINPRRPCRLHSDTTEPIDDLPVLIRQPCTLRLRWSDICSNQ